MSLPSQSPFQEHDPSKVKGKFHISMRTNKVYNIEERKLFCSALCFKSSSFLRDQLETSPLWLREGDTPAAPVRLYGEEEEGEKDEGAMDWTGGQVQLEKPAPEILLPPERVFRVETDPAEQAVRVLKSWFTVDSFRLVQGEERLREELRRQRVEREAWAPSVGDPALEEQYQARYRDLARRLDMMEIREERGEEQEQRLPMPSFEMLRHDMQTENQKLSSFLAGRSSYQDAGGVKEAVLEEGGLEPRLPPVDHQAQLQLRRGIVLERLAHSLPPVLQPLGLSLQAVREGLRELVSSFQLQATTVSLAPPAWRLTGLLLLHLLAVRDLEVAAALQQRAEVQAAMLAELGLAADFPDNLVKELTSDVMPLLAKYNIKYT